MRQRHVWIGLVALGLCLLLPLGCNKAAKKTKGTSADNMSAKGAKPTQPSVVVKGVAPRFSHLPASTAVGLRLRVDVLARAKRAYAQNTMLSKALAEMTASLKKGLGVDLSVPAELKAWGLDIRGSVTALVYGARKPLEKSLGQVARIVKNASAHKRSDAFAKHVSLSGFSVRVVLPLSDPVRFQKALRGSPLFKVSGSRIHIAGSSSGKGTGNPELIGPLTKLWPKVVWLAEGAVLAVGVWIHKDRALVELLFPVRRPASDAEMLRLALKTWGSPEPTSLAHWSVRALGVKADLSLTVVAKNAGFLGHAIGVSQMLGALGGASPAERSVLVDMGFKVSKNPVNLQTRVPGYFRAFGAALLLTASGAKGSFRWQLNTAGKSLFGALPTPLKNVNLLQGGLWQQFVATLTAAVTSRKAQGLFALSSGPAQRDYLEGGMFMHLVTLAQCWPELFRFKVVPHFVLQFPPVTVRLGIQSVRLTQIGQDLSLRWK